MSCSTRLAGWQPEVAAQICYMPARTRDTNHGRRLSQSSDPSPHLLSFCCQPAMTSSGAGTVAFQLGRSCRAFR